MTIEKKKINKIRKNKNKLKPENNTVKQKKKQRIGKNGKKEKTQKKIKGKHRKK